MTVWFAAARDDLLVAVARRLTAEASVDATEALDALGRLGPRELDLLARLEARAAGLLRPVEICTGEPVGQALSIHRPHPSSSNTPTAKEAAA